MADLSFYKSPFAEEIREEGRQEGRFAVVAEALAELLPEGRERSRTEVVLFVLERRGVELSDAARERITGCEDPWLPVRWLRRALTATSTEDVFTEA
ncbi:hypothetical protein CRI70_15410 [Streptomyces sp. Ru87]|uniref:Acetoacetate--CoA ligase family protein n=1 Tax=Streptomyces lycii TaxID=2654337 RepID=A0ABQ7FRF0_9ACTN|nr:acetoacetate--CoA ligase family protein [Streptomyces lycii]PGH49832.1 hypothetical protein CRI70_15410 [Streptomyces sp. Ru87]